MAVVVFSPNPSARGPSKPSAADCPPPRLPAPASTPTLFMSRASTPSRRSRQRKSDRGHLGDAAQTKAALQTSKTAQNSPENRFFLAGKEVSAPADFKASQ